MPTFRNVTVSLISQYDVLTIPEYHPPSSQSLTPDEQIPNLVHPTQPVVSVYIPIYPLSTFWLSYFIDVSSPALSASPAVPFYYFKLFVNGTHVVSWGCGEEDDFKGKTMFGIFRSQDGIGPLEKRVLMFEEEGNEGGVIELRIFRAKARGRVRIKHDTVPEHSRIEGSAAVSTGTGSIVLHKAGSLSLRHPKRFYNYYLLDAIDRPHVTFRYLYCTIGALNQLGITTPTSSTTPSPCSSRSSSPSKDPDLSAKELRLNKSVRNGPENLPSTRQGPVGDPRIGAPDPRTKSLPPRPHFSLRSGSTTVVAQDISGSPRPKSFPTLQKPCSGPLMDSISQQPTSRVISERENAMIEASSTTPQPMCLITSEERTPDPENRRVSPRPKRISSLLGPPILFPGALYPTPPTCSISRSTPSPCPSPTKASFSNTVSLLIAPPRQETSGSSIGTELQTPKRPENLSNQRAKSPSKFKIADFLVRRDDDSKSSRHSVGKRRTGQKPTSPGSGELISEFGKVEPGLGKYSEQDIGGKENSVLEGVGTMPRGQNILKGKIWLGGKRKKGGKMVALAESRNEASTTTVTDG